MAQRLLSIAPTLKVSTLETLLSLDTVAEDIVLFRRRQKPMFSEKISTIEEVAQYLRVSEDVLLQEVAAGRLDVLRFGDDIRDIRIRESDLNAYLNANLESARKTVVVLPAAKGGESRNSFNLSAAKPFNHSWPATAGTEKFTDAVEGIVSDGGRERHVKLGFTVRKSAGKNRRRALVLIDRYPTVEFVAADEKSRGKMASIIRDRNGKQLPVGATLPPEYKDLPTGAYNDVVQGPRASNGVAVICDSHDFVTMVRHALIRFRFRKARA
jgi:excisionase family DNA binding protein